MTRSAADQDYQRRALDYVRHVVSTTGLSPTTLAKRAGITPSTLNRPLRDPDQSKGLTVRTIGRIAQATGIDPSPYLSLGGELTRDWLNRLSKPIATAPHDVVDVLAFLHFIRAEHRIDVPERHFETLRALISQQTKAPT